MSTEKSARSKLILDDSPPSDAGLKVQEDMRSFRWFNENILQYIREEVNRSVKAAMREFREEELAAKPAVKSNRARTTPVKSDIHSPHKRKKAS